MRRPRRGWMLAEVIRRSLLPAPMHPCEHFRTEGGWCHDIVEEGRAMVIIGGKGAWTDNERELLKLIAHR